MCMCWLTAASRTFSKPRLVTRFDLSRLVRHLFGAMRPMTAIQLNFMLAGWPFASCALPTHCALSYALGIINSYHPLQANKLVIDSLPKFSPSPFEDINLQCTARMVSNTVRVIVGILGNAASMLLYAAPILTFRRVIKKANVEEFSCVPYILALFNCLLYTWYGLPVVSSRWENFPVSTINGLGILLEITFISIYVWFAPREKKKFVLQMVLPLLTFFGLTAFFSSFIFHTHRMRKVFVGSIGLVASISMYSSPMVAAKQVITTKSVEFMPFYLSLFSFLSSALWMIYGLLGRDLFIASPNFIGCPMGMFQLVMYCIYRKSDETTEKFHDIDQENGLKVVTTHQKITGKKPEVQKD